MAQRVVFLVHGMGDHRPGWSDPVKQKLIKHARTYDAFADGTLLRELSFVEITYDGVFDTQVKSFGADAAELRKFVGDAFSTGKSKSPLGKLLKWLEDAQGDGTGKQQFFWSHAIDVVLYHFFPLIRDPVRVSVMEQISKAITDAKKGGAIAETFVLAHSLGTAVATDALALLGSMPFKGSNAFLAGAEKFKHIFTAANVSRVLKDDIDPYTSVVHPDTATFPSAGGAYCGRFTSFRHILDPFCWLHAFDPPSWGNKFKNVVDLAHLRAINVHGFEHYLDNPRVHISILNGIFERPVIDAFAQDVAIKSYPLIAGACVDELRALGRALQELAVPTDVEEMIMRGTEASALARAAQDRCAGVVSSTATHV